MFHDWGKNIIIIQGTDIIRTIHVAKKLGAPTKCPKILVCYDFHFRIFDKEEDLMFATKHGLCSIKTIIVLTSIWLYQLVKLITSIGLNLVEHVIVHVEFVSKSHVSSNILVKLVFVLHVKIIISLDTFQQHLL
jgi:hypothetical protein